MQDYRQLRVHANAHSLAVRVRGAARKFPRTGYTSLKAQMTTAAESIAFNIVEGCGAESPKEFARFLDIAIKSAMELEYQLTLVRDYRVLPAGEAEILREHTVEARRMLYGLRKRVIASVQLTQKRSTQKR
jgi:four helix bundle protein